MCCLGPAAPAGIPSAPDRDNTNEQNRSRTLRTVRRGRWPAPSRRHREADPRRRRVVLVVDVEADPGPRVHPTTQDRDAVHDGMGCRHGVASQTDLQLCRVVESPTVGVPHRARTKAVRSSIGPAVTDAEIAIHFRESRPLSGYHTKPVTLPATSHRCRDRPAGPGEEQTPRPRRARHTASGSPVAKSARARSTSRSPLDLQSRGPTNSSNRLRITRRSGKR